MEVVVEVVSTHIAGESDLWKGQKQKESPFFASARA